MLRALLGAALRILTVTAVVLAAAAGGATVRPLPAAAVSSLTPLAHRGFDGYHREGSYVGMWVLADAGAPYLELDLRWTADHVPVIWHDPAIWDATHCSGPATGLLVQDVSAAHLDATTCDGLPIATLAQVIDLLVDYPSLRLWLEPKAGGLSDLLPLLSPIRARTTIEGAVSADLNLVKTSGYGACYLGRGLADLIGGAIANHWPCVAPDYRDTGLTAARVTQGRNAGVTVVPFTVNAQAGLNRMCGLGVRFVVTDQWQRARSTSC